MTNKDTKPSLEQRIEEMNATGVIMHNLGYHNYVITRSENDNINLLEWHKEEFDKALSIIKELQQSLAEVREENKRLEEND
jgi:hypothetical protein